MNEVWRSALVASVAVFSAGVATTALAQVRHFVVPAEEAAKSIPEFARQAGVQITAPVSQLHGVKTPAILGDLDLRAALQQLLNATGLEIASDDGMTIVLRKQSAADPPPILGIDSAREVGSGNTLS